MALSLQARVLDSMVEGVSLSDENGIILYTNPAEDTMFGYERGELLGQHVTVQNTYAPEENARIVSEVIEQLKSRGAWFGEFSNRKKDGTPFTTFARITAIEVSGKRCWVCVQEDITERKRAETEREQLLAREQQARKEAEAAVRARDEFLSIVSHELRSPLTTIQGHAQLLRRRLGGDGVLDPAQADRALRAITAQAETLAGLIAQLVDISRIEASKLVLERRDTDLRQLVEGAAAAARIRTDRHSIGVRSPTRPRAWVDPPRLEQVLTNLLDNAIKYSPDGGPIEVELSEPSDGTAEITVRDRGLGIPPERRGRIFERFYQAHAELGSGGMGIGLYISHQIVELHGGELRAEFPEDGGTRFVVRLPTGPGEPVPGC